MISAMFRIMGLGLWRDRGAVLLAFALPSLVFAIFASIFSGATEGELHLRVGVVLDTEDGAWADFAESLHEIPGVKLTLLAGMSAEELAQKVRRGDLDTGLVVQGTPEPADALFTVLMEPSRRIAAVSLEGLLRQHLSQHAPQILARRQLEAAEPAVGGYTAEQRAMAEARLQAMSSSPATGPARAPSNPPLVGIRSVHSTTADAISGRGGLAYYAGATTILFLLLSAVNAGMASLEERQSGVEERLLLGMSARARMLVGRFLFLVCLGSVQAAVIFLVARLGFGLPVENAWLEVSAVTLACAIASAGLALLVLSLCHTAQQAATFSSFFVLVISAVGGSMVPRFMMPEWLQTLSWFTPNAWAIEGYYGAIMRGDSWSNTLRACGTLAAAGLGCLLLAALPLRKPA